jgi:hypothetical protein
LINVPELKELGLKSFIIYDRRKPLAPMAQEFLQILRAKRKLSIAVNDPSVRVGGARTLSVH